MTTDKRAALKLQRRQIEARENQGQKLKYMKDIQLKIQFKIWILCNPKLKKNRHQN